MSGDELDLIANAVLARGELLNKMFDSRRDIDDECGYPKTYELLADKYQVLYDREAVARRVVNVLPRETWQVTPKVFEDSDPKNKTPFEASLETLQTNLTGGSKFNNPKMNVFWELLKRADMLCGIGYYGGVLLGIDDGLELSEPAEHRKGAKLNYMRAFPEQFCTVTKVESEKTNPRYSLPTEYNVTFNDPSNASPTVGVSLATLKVHWTRIIHVADNLNSSEIFGTPRMQPVYNRIWDLRKLYGGSAEMYWRGAFPGIALETHPQLGGDVNIDTAAIRTEMTSYMDGLQRYMSLMGMSAKSLAPQVVDPTPQINTQLESICIDLNIPKRIFVGSERGQLASGQDDDTWTDRLVERETNHVTPRIVVPAIDRLINLGVLEEPAEYFVEWPNRQELDPITKATIAVSKTDALSKYVMGEVFSIIPPMEYLTTILDIPEEEAMAILQSAVGFAGDDSEPLNQKEEDDGGSVETTPKAKVPN
jgi:hypothetical protein